MSAKFTKFDTLEVGKTYSRNLVPLDTQRVAIPLDSGKTYSVETNNEDMHLAVYNSLRDRNYLAYVFNGVNTFTSHRAGYFFIKIFSGINPASWNFTLKVTDNSTNESQ
mgnify:CR=1 FL=1